MAPGKPGTIRREPVWYPSRIPPPATQQTVGWLAYVPTMGWEVGYRGGITASSGTWFGALRRHYGGLSVPRNRYSSRSYVPSRSAGCPRRWPTASLTTASTEARHREVPVGSHNPIDG